MSCHGNHATAPSPAIAPGIEAINPALIAIEVGRRGMDPRITRRVPAFDAPFFQAGLAGYSDAAMRIIARRHGCPFCVTEALLDRTVLAGGRGFAKADLGEIEDNVPGGEEDHPLAGQIMGSDPAEMAAAALKMVEQGTRADKAYRRMAYAGALAPGTEFAGCFSRQHLRLPGGQQVGVWPPVEDIRDGTIAAAQALADGAAPDEEGPTPGVPALTFATIDVNLACPVKKIK
ncbi:MAG: hypothetical protein H7Y88_12725, partial [Phycisphaerales bacterium]|nr:hypothetical protein [Phycisphaerales bacterium]